METTIPSFPGTTAVDVSGRLNTFTPTETDGSKAHSVMMLMLVVFAAGLGLVALILRLLSPQIR